MLLVSIVKVLQSQLQLILKEPSLMFKIHNLKDILFGKIFEGEVSLASLVFLRFFSAFVMCLIFYFCIGEFKKFNHLLLLNRINLAIPLNRMILAIHFEFLNRPR